MIVVVKNQGAKIPYDISGNKITFDDDLTINLAKREQDEGSHIDICRDSYGSLVLGVIPGLAEAYVAQLDIPTRSYRLVADGTDIEGNPKQRQEAVPFNMEAVTLTLWEV